VDFEEPRWSIDGIAVRRTPGGYAVQGPGFYVWDQDLAEVLRAARNLCRAAGAPDGPALRRPALRDP